MGEGVDAEQRQTEWDFRQRNPMCYWAEPQQEQKMAEPQPLWTANHLRLPMQLGIPRQMEELQAWGVVAGDEATGHEPRERLDFGFWLRCRIALGNLRLLPRWLADYRRV